MKRLLGVVVSCALASTAIAEPREQTRSESLRTDATYLAVIGGVTLAFGGVFAWGAHQRSEEIEQYALSPEPWPENIFELEREGQRLEALSNVSFVLGGSFVVAGALCYWRSRVAANEERTSRVTVSPIATETSAGIALGGRF